MQRILKFISSILVCSNLVASIYKYTYVYEIDLAYYFYTLIPVIKQLVVY